MPIQPGAAHEAPVLRPLVSVSTGLPDYLVRTRLLVEAAIRRRWSEGLLNQDPDGVFTSFLGADHIDRLIHPTPVAHEPFGEHVYDRGAPLGRFAAVQGLSSSQADLFALLLACEIDPAAARLLSYLGGNQAQFVLSLDLVFEVVYRARSARYDEAAALLHEDLAPRGRLRQLRFVTLDDAASLSSLAQPIRLAPRLLPWLLGQRGLDAALRSLARLEPPAEPDGCCDATALERVIAAFGDGGRLVTLGGAAYSGRSMLLRFAAARLDRPLLLVGGGARLGADQVVAAFREAALHRALLALRDDGLDAAATAALRDCLDAYDATVALITGGAERDTAAQHAGARPVTAVTLEPPPIGERLELWRGFLGDAATLPAEDLVGVASLYNVGVAGIAGASRAARRIAADEGRPVARGHLLRAMRQLYHADLASVANRVEVTQTWSDLVLPEEMGESIVAIIDRVRHRGEVLGNWGFARKLGKGLGTTVLFSGEAGTGKSMVAGLVAAELGLDLYVLNLSRLMSKWLGETEKNLARAFDAAEAGHVMLLFDEADTILGKRTTDVRSSNDRYANLETNYVLARLEQFHGTAIFTTNLASAVDPAMERRMSVHVHFPFPDVEARAEMWRRMIPAEASVEPGINFDALAARYELSGGFIRNVILRAAFLAARLKESLGMRHLIDAAELEYHERGALITGGRLA